MVDAGDLLASGQPPAYDTSPEGPGPFQKDLYSPYHVFTSEEWAQFRADTPLTLSENEVKRLRSLDDPIDLEEVRRIYLSLSRLLSAHVE